MRVEGSRAELARRYDGRVGHDRAGGIIQRGDHRQGLAVRPDREIIQFLIGRHHGNVEGIGGRRRGNATLPRHGVIALQAFLQRSVIAAAGVDDAAGRQRIELVGRGAGRREVAVDVEDEVGGVGDEHTDRALCAGRHDGSIRLDATIG